MNQHDRSIRDLTPDERAFVMRTLTDVVGAAPTFRRFGRSGDVRSVEAIEDLLSLPQWPAPDRTPIELAWLSKPLENPTYGRLKGYAVFWGMIDDGFAVWVARTPQKLRDKSESLCNDEVASAIAAAYGFFLSREDRNRKRLIVLRRRFLSALIPVSLILVVPAIMLWILFVTQETRLQELSFGDVSTIAAYTFAACLGYISWLLYGRIGAWIVILVSYVVGAAFLPLKPGWEQEGEGLALVIPFLVGVSVTWSKHRDLMMMTGREILDGRFRSSLTIIATWAFATATIFGAFELLRFAIDEVFVKGNTIRGIMIVIVAIALAEFLRRELR